MSHSFSLRRSSFVGLRSCHSGCAQQALPECSAHQYYSFRPYSGYHLSGLFPDGNTCWLFINRYGYRRGVVFGLLLFGVGALLFIPGATVGSFSAFLLCLFIIGCGLVFLETAANPYVTELGAKETATSRLNLSQSFNGLGGILPHFASVSSSSTRPKRAAMWWCLIPFWVFWFW